MRTYTVKEISESAGVSQETVRRWIREGKLEGTKSSRKQGNRITEDALRRFVQMAPAARAGIATLFGVTSVVLGPATAAASVGAGMAIGTAIASLDSLKKETSKKDDFESLAITIDRASKVVDGLRESMAEKAARIETLTKEMADTQDVIDDLNRVIKAANTKMLTQLDKKKEAVE